MGKVTATAAGISVQNGKDMGPVTAAAALPLLLMMMLLLCACVVVVVVEGREQTLEQRLQANRPSRGPGETDDLVEAPPLQGPCVYASWPSVQSWALAEHKAFRPVPFLAPFDDPALQGHSGDVIHLAVGDHLKDGC